MTNDSTYKKFSFSSIKSLVGANLIISAFIYNKDFSVYSIIGLPSFT